MPAVPGAFYPRMACRLLAGPLLLIAPTGQTSPGGAPAEIVHTFFRERLPLQVAPHPCRLRSPSPGSRSSAATGTLQRASSPGAPTRRRTWPSPHPRDLAPRRCNRYRAAEAGRVPAATRRSDHVPSRRAPRRGPRPGRGRTGHGVNHAGRNQVNHLAGVRQTRSLTDFDAGNGRGGRAPARLAQRAPPRRGADPLVVLSGQRGIGDPARPRSAAASLAPIV